MSERGRGLSSAQMDGKISLVVTERVKRVTFNEADGALAERWLTVFAGCEIQVGVTQKLGSLPTMQHSPCPWLHS